MAFEVGVYQVTKEKSGTLSVYMKAVDTATGEVLGKMSVQGKTKEEIKAAMKAQIERAHDEYAKRQSWVEMAQEAANEIVAEVKK